MRKKERSDGRHPINGHHEARVSKAIDNMSQLGRGERGRGCIWLEFEVD